MIAVLALAVGCGGDVAKKGGGNNANNANNANNGNNVNNLNSQNNTGSNNRLNNSFNNPVNSSNNAANNVNNANNPPNNQNNPPNGNPNNTAGGCLSNSDAEIVLSGQTEGVAEECAFGCFEGGEDLSDCTTGCVAAETGLSRQCSSCYGLTVECVFTNCIGECIEDPNSAVCLECQADAGCDDQFVNCSGLPRR